MAKLDEHEINQRIDLIQAHMSRATADGRNTLHACRHNHPLGRGKDRTDLFREAAFVLSGRVPTDDVVWLNQIANQFHDERAA